MSDNAGPSELVSRLHALRVKNGLTIQQMADRCNLPKSSLESYMRFDGARRPGVDALVAIADGMDVSIDWLVGRSRGSFPASLTEKDYAMACFSTVQSLITWMQKEQSKRSGPILEGDTVAGIGRAEIAAKSMLVFVETVDLFRANAGPIGDARFDLYERMSELLTRSQG